MAGFIVSKGLILFVHSTLSGRFYSMIFPATKKKKLWSGQVIAFSFIREMFFFPIFSFFSVIYAYILQVHEVFSVFEVHPNFSLPCRQLWKTHLPVRTRARPVFSSAPQERTDCCLFANIMPVVIFVNKVDLLVNGPRYALILLLLASVWWGEIVTRAFAFEEKACLQTNWSIATCMCILGLSLRGWRRSSRNS